MAPPKGIKQLNFHVEEKLHARFKRYCIERRMTMHDMLNKWIHEALEKEREEFQERILPTAVEQKRTWESSY